ncbi:phospholipid carrier-dependent glycosyltransferase [Uliginosibacterium sp. H3]|uniref:Polyprenol-phosphate-mannose--protein mannosyltransferase n=1 Tax=Uliginosibacterium silvisoli TaxID=3114758 RepID=A0ABU6K6S0_9RHOO|nr:phospholipid carrier-dependent glycosyltransferase [Uliginosibacterium sp. H3]
MSDTLSVSPRENGPETSLENPATLSASASGRAPSARRASSWRTGWLLLSAITVFSLLIHFWGLSRFNGLVFDEVFFPKYAQNHIENAPYFDGHPPLGKMLIAVGMRASVLTGQLGVDANNEIGTPYPAWAYRWIDALAGALLPLVFAGIVWQLCRRWRPTLLAALLVSLDGLFLVEARYGLINIFLMFFGLLGHYLFLCALNTGRPVRHYVLILLAGTSLGAAIAVKWSGVAFLAVPWGLWLLAWLQKLWFGWIRQRRHAHTHSQSAHHHAEVETHPLQKSTRLGIWTMLLALLVVPLVVYVLQWQPYLRVNNTNFMDIHRQMLAFHEGVKDGPSEHPYCSRWSTWPVMERPVSYLFTARSPQDLNPTAPPPPDAPQGITHVVHAMGNPALWWFAVPAVLAATALALRGGFLASIGLAQSLPHRRRGRLRFSLPALPRKRSPLSATSWTAIYLSAGYVVSLLPWIGITRCSFIYHYMPSVAFGFVACAFGIDRLMADASRGARAAGLCVLLLIVAAFFYWLPLFLGLEISMDDWYARMWFKSWI